MSYGISAFAVDLKAIEATIGSRNATLLQKLEQEFSRRAEELDENDDPDEESTSANSILRDLVMSGLPEETVDQFNGRKYGFVLELLCEHFGEWLSNNHWSSMRGTWFDTVDEELRKAGRRVGRKYIRTGNRRRVNGEV